ETAVSRIEELSQRRILQQQRRCDSAARAYGERPPSLRPSEAGDLVHEPRRDALDFFRSKVDHDHHELVAAVARNQILGPSLPVKQRADVAKHDIAGDVTKRIVDLFEV